MSDTPWPQLDKGRPVHGAWRQPPRPPAAPPPEPRPGDPAILDASLVPAPAVAVSAAAGPEAAAAEPRACLECGGEVDADGYCTQCGAKAPSARDHFEEATASWVGGVCDRGVRHARNEDALATAADAAPGSRAALVVCDGVTTSDDSDVAALAAARAARDLLVEGRPEAMGTPASRNAAVSALFTRAAAVANDAVAQHTRAGAENPAACTFVAALVHDGVVHVANVGDSRAYWLPDGAEGRILTRDDSLAEASIANGVPRKEAEDAADAHTLTRWLGIDAQDVVPHTAAAHVTGPGWVLVCSDGLWNYASTPAALAMALAQAVDAARPLPAGGAADPAPNAAEPAPASAPVDVARALVRWANAQGGHDNVTVALARVGVQDEAEDASAAQGEQPDRGTTRLAAPGAQPAGGESQAAASETVSALQQAHDAAHGAPAASGGATAYDPIRHVGLGPGRADAPAEEG